MISHFYAAALSSLTEKVKGDPSDQVVVLFDETILEMWSDAVHLTALSSKIFKL